MFFVKVIISALIVASVSELSKRSSFWAALLISLPIVSVLSFVWIYIESKDAVKVQTMSWEVLYLIIPSMLFFVALPLLLKAQLNFWLALVVSLLITSLAYFITSKLFII